MQRSSLAWVASVAALVVGGAWAQGGGGGPGPGMGPGAGPGPRASAPGMGPGAGMARGPMARWGADYTPGWALMTAQERAEHQERMRSMKTYEECKAYRDQHHEQMAARAKEKGGKPLAGPRRDACAGLKP